MLISRVIAAQVNIPCLTNRTAHAIESKVFALNKAGKLPKTMTKTKPAKRGNSAGADCKADTNAVVNTESMDPSPSSNLDPELDAGLGSGIEMSEEADVNPMDWESDAA